MDDPAAKAGPGPSSLALAHNEYRGYVPPKWRRFQDQLEGRVGELPSSGAHVTLKDLIRKTEARLAEEDAVVDPSVDVFEPIDPSERITGWVGTPDPRKYAPGTTSLTKDELQQEVEAGNVVYASDWVKAMQSLEPWEENLLACSIMNDYAKYRMLIQVEGEGGGVVSLHDLHAYVHHNPELKALVERRRDIASASQAQSGQPGQVPEYLAPFVGAPGNDKAMQLPREMVEQLPWALVGSGSMWRRRPTRWLKGMDGVKDFTFGVYVHEQQAREVLGPRWGDTTPRTALFSDAYWQDVLAAGPQMGMTFMLAAARDVPVADVGKVWGSRLAARMAVRGRSPQDISNELGALGGLLTPGELRAHTRLLSPQGTHLRAGSTLLLTLAPGGRLVLQAMTGDPIREREYYSIGALDGAPELAGAVASFFLGAGSAREPPIDQNVVAYVGAGVLQAARGRVVGAVDSSDARATRSPHRVAVAALAAAKPGAFKLPALGAKAQAGQPAPVVLHDVQRSRLIMQLGSVFNTAAQAADAATDKSKPFESQVAQRCAAAEASLKAGLAGLGLDMEGMGLQIGASPRGSQQRADLFAAAAPLGKAQ
uniref:Uncharacterized protein n=1 Tax=Chlamydomonas leiostraca TaxID=1034604 RepID=A0A7S0WP52_9CHLO|mmetsp:Transcript_2154/g.5463  ORF Transcript_2154/g.5463 Transcript_2154/m.5463 type:complete len:596 (+) Transcript_2154:47-1834(+)|eukprot:CAMPEP_0202858454 /NCGR_PEP_ID=MMETSP1391-20130828/986_1 /ASSEMBLY_ACC=CAM_ASM_000867 /TAXON_ID=1034604 /ORGANISM="Chlamydomonas leiostraca, Strain SAG 11-49" /LENGTH=595 /DNA_ID=CAMNT_0049537377 /DNA_START=45 /DNA_END=1832 /DNA_ORIENTATION=-